MTQLVSPREWGKSNRAVPPLVLKKSNSKEPVAGLEDRMTQIEVAIVDIMDRLRTFESG